LELFEVVKFVKIFSWMDMVEILLLKIDSNEENDVLKIFNDAF